MKIGLEWGYGNKEFSCGYFVFERPVAQPDVFRRQLEIRYRYKTRKLASYHFHPFSLTIPM